MRLGKGYVRDVAWSPDRTLLAVGGTAGIWLYDAHTGAEVSLITGHSFRVNGIAFSPDGLTLASGSRDDTVRLWDVNTGEKKVSSRDIPTMSRRWHSRQMGRPWQAAVATVRYACGT